MYNFEISLILARTLRLTVESDHHMPGRQICNPSCLGEAEVVSESQEVQSQPGNFGETLLLNKLGLKVCGSSFFRICEAIAQRPLVPFRALPLSLLDNTTPSLFRLQCTVMFRTEAFVLP